MASPITITIAHSSAFALGDRGQIEIAGVVQPDRIELGGIPGPAPTLPFGGGRFGAGYFGRGAASFAHRTLASFIAGDYSVRIRSIDPVGNTSAWSTAKIIQHRPVPPSPTSLSVNEAGELVWTWSDP